MTLSASSRIDDVGPWYLVDRTTLVFANKQAFQQGPAHEIDHDENGHQIHPNESGEVWTGRLDALGNANAYCGGWTLTANSQTGMLGHARATSADWTGVYPNFDYCDRAIGRLYCFEQ